MAGCDSPPFDLVGHSDLGESNGKNQELESPPVPIGRLSWFEDAEDTPEAYRWSFGRQSKISGLDSGLDQRSKCRKIADLIVDYIVMFEASKEPERKSQLARFEEHTRPFFLCVIMIHCGWMVHAVNYEAANPDEHVPGYFQSVEIALTSISSCLRRTPPTCQCSSAATQQRSRN